MVAFPSTFPTVASVSRSGELRKIFQRFYRVGRDVQRAAAGLGLGLFIVRNLVRRQGGRVEARSEGEAREVGSS